VRAHGFAYQPALDGVRAVAVALVLLFHQGWLDGGYLGVSVFFTLSGYLITSLALGEHDRTGRLDVGAFYGRRLRRLLPASLACLAGIVVLAGVGLFGGVDGLRRDIWGALAQVYNWVALSGGQTYAELVAAGNGPVSPVEHYWSLAIEEQFYWVWPVVLVAVLRAGRRRRVLAVAGLAAAAGVAAPLIAGVWGPDAAYWATPARLGEILVGALVAVVLHGRRRDVSLPAGISWLAVAGLAVVVWAAVTWPSGAGPAYDGWLPVFALASAALVVGLQVPSPLRQALGAAPLVALGAISYGVYLYHWPVYVVLDAERTGLAAVPLFAVRITVTLAVAVVSYRALERPIRAGRLRWRPGLPAALAGCAAIAIAVAVVPADSTPYWMRRGAEASAATLAPIASVAELRVVEPAATPPATVAPTTTTTVAAMTTAVATTALATTTLATTTTTTLPPVPAVPPLPTGLSRPVRIMVVGDSTAWATGDGMVDWAADHADIARVAVQAAPGCGFIRGGLVPTDADDSFRGACEDFRDDRIPSSLRSLHPDVVVGMVTFRDLTDRVWDDAEGPLGPSDERFYARLVDDYDVATQEFLSGGASDVLWVLAPIPDVLPPNEGWVQALDPARYERYAAALHEVAARHPGQAGVVDLAAWLAAQPALPERPDGLHWSLDAASAIATDFLGPIVTTAAVS